jgi:hypothetical protein
MNLGLIREEHIRENFPANVKNHSCNWSKKNEHPIYRTLSQSMWGHTNELEKLSSPSFPPNNLKVGHSSRNQVRAAFCYYVFGGRGELTE